MFIDTHAHLNFVAFDEDRNEIIKKCLENDVWMINIGTNFQTSKKAIEIAKKYEKGVYVSVGLHPINLHSDLVKVKLDEQEGQHFEKEFDYEKYKNLAQSQKVVAVGEIGLDYYWKPKTTKRKEIFKQKQKELFLKELELAKELNLPVIFHCRVAHDDLLQILNYKLKTINYKLNAVMHGFVGTSEQLEKYLNLGLYIGFNGITFKKIEGINFEENIKITPLERILVETDCPYLPPPNFAKKRNDPLGVKFVAEKIAKIKKVSLEKVAEITTQNAQKLFDL